MPFGVLVPCCRFAQAIDSNGWQAWHPPVGTSGESTLQQSSSSLWSCQGLRWVEIVGQDLAPMLCGMLQAFLDNLYSACRIFKCWLRLATQISIKIWEDDADYLLLLVRISKPQRNQPQKTKTWWEISIVSDLFLRKKMGKRRRLCNM